MTTHRTTWITELIETIFDDVVDDQSWATRVPLAAFTFYRVVKMIVLIMAAWQTSFVSNDLGLICCNSWL